MTDRDTPQLTQRTRVALIVHAGVMAVLAIVAFVGADGFADLFDISSGTVMLTAVGGAVLVGVIAALIAVPTARVALTIAGGINIVLGGTLLGLAPSAPTTSGVTTLVVVAVVFAILAMVEIGLRGKDSRPPIDPSLAD